MKRPLLITLSGLAQGETVLMLEHEPEELGLDECEVRENPSFVALVGHVREQLRIVRDGSRVLIRGRVAFGARLLCAACGGEYHQDFDEDLSAQTAGCSPRGPAHGLAVPELDEVPLTGDVLDLTGIVRDAVHLAIPIAPRCRPDCRGVCARCGADLNRGSCGCHAAEPD